jgi:hypothetical protein
MRVHQLRYFITVVRRIAPETAVVAYWAEEFPTVRDTAVIFSLADLDMTPP